MPTWLFAITILLSIGVILCTLFLTACWESFDDLEDTETILLLQLGLIVLVGWPLAILLALCVGAAWILRRLFLWVDKKRG